MMKTENPVMTTEDCKHAQELWRLSGEVRVLKWGAAIVVTMMFAYLTYLAQQVNGLRGDLTQQNIAIQQQFNVMQEGQAAIRERLTAIEQRLGALERQYTALNQEQTVIRERLTTVEQRLAAGSI